MRSTIEEAANWARDEFLPKAPLPSIVVIVVVIISSTMMHPSFGSLIAIMIICGLLMSMLRYIKQLESKGT